MEATLQNYKKEFGQYKNAWPILFGLLVLYVPTTFTLLNGPWEKTEYAHGPIVLAVVLWLIWREREHWTTLEARPSKLAGSLILGFGCLLYALGRSQTIMLFEVGSAIPVVTGVLLLTKGWPAIRKLWFPIAFIVFLVPLPGFIIDALTGPLKMNVSMIVNEILYNAGYPIARNGVVLTIGPYQLLIADACSGLNSMYALSALGLLFVYLKQTGSKLQNAILIASILPIAFITNIVRVLVLSLITYYLGDEAGQGFTHDFAAFMEFVIALGLLFVVDVILVFSFTRRTKNV